MDPIEQIRTLYFNATPASILDDFARAIDLLKAMPTEEQRERATVYMEGLAQMRSEWAATRKAPPTDAGRRSAGGPADRRSPGVTSRSRKRQGDR